MARPKSDIDERIVQAARARFLEDGVDGASLRRIADAAGTSVGMIYYYFPTKDELFLAAIERPYAVLLEGLSAALDPSLPITGRFARMFDRFARMSDEEHTVLRLVIRELLVSTKRRKRVLERFAKGHMPMVLGVIVEGIQTGALTSELPLAPMMIATVMLGLAPQVIRNLVGDRMNGDVALPSPAELATAMSHILLAGIGSQGAAEAKTPQSKGTPPATKKRASASKAKSTG